MPRLHDRYDHDMTQNDFSHKQICRSKGGVTLGVIMTTDQFWQPDKQTRSAIRRGDKINREYLKRKTVEYKLSLSNRISAEKSELSKGKRTNALESREAA